MKDVCLSSRIVALAAVAVVGIASAACEDASIPPTVTPGLSLGGGSDCPENYFGMCYRAISGTAAHEFLENTRDSGHWEIDGVCPDFRDHFAAALENGQFLIMDSISIHDTFGMLDGVYDSENDLYIIDEAHLWSGWLADVSTHEGGHGFLGHTISTDREVAECDAQGLQQACWLGPLNSDWVIDTCPVGGGGGTS